MCATLKNESIFHFKNPIESLFFHLETSPMICVPTLSTRQQKYETSSYHRPRMHNNNCRFLICFVFRPPFVASLPPSLCAA